MTAKHTKFLSQSRCTTRVIIFPSPHSLLLNWDWISVFLTQFKSKGVNLHGSRAVAGYILSLREIGTPECPMIAHQ
ncbi:hypothetical protein CANTEDRAFT_116244 [Yamadazyma tenuis ATCC 10573]|uniref:Uncharacterized protein n=1 Tax=Candida tenuis (strain ATCC 10573 / BCRC 21748 / CBS 615 / JCM 9827 / NBRC 10315 / NRRL Y-1498 / VKM Y-70) TaxID=590646 RepID=G3BCJ8_CANTC|nr:uncharacterized protein CANTEDRAFT_116244 [Yamadazyma tenuis ATCC 10573]EGV60182.1 hypothetical protein CANTEDRAFT_116244 [Yamadazyma tenuis ATCC 10573]